MKRTIILSPIENGEFLDMRAGLRTKEGVEVVQEETLTRFWGGYGDISQWRGRYHIRGATVDMRYVARLGNEPGKIGATMYGDEHALWEAQGTLLFFVGQKKLSEERAA